LEERIAFLFARRVARLDRALQDVEACVIVDLDLVAILLDVSNNATDSAGSDDFVTSCKLGQHLLVLLLLFALGLDQKKPETNHKENERHELHPAVAASALCLGEYKEEIIHFLKC
jgi:hypothetical protein